MKSRSIIFALCAALLALPLWRAAAQPRQGPPSPDEIKAMARELQEKQRERERLSERKELIPLEDISSRPTFASDPNFAYLRLTYDAEPEAFLDRFGGPYLLLIGGLFALPLIMGYACRR